jgi:glycosyltransferase involved in cell wall biosynthesis
VLHVYKTSLPYTHGGIEEVILQLCRATTKLGVNNKVVCISKKCKKKEIISTPHAMIYCYPMSFEIASCSFSWSLWFDFKKLSTWADVIHYQFPWPFADLLALTRQSSSKPYIVSYQSDIIRQNVLNKLYQPLMNKFLDKAASVVATSQNYISSSTVLRTLEQAPVFIPNGIDKELDPASYQEEKEEYEKTYGQNFFLFLGVFRYYKGLNYLLKAAQKTGLEVVIGGDGAEAEKLYQYVQEHDLTNVHFLGYVTEQQKHALIDLSSALILPSSERSEAYGMVLLEAARQGTPMISTELDSGTSYINAHNETGLVISAKSSVQLAAAMQEMTGNEDMVKLMSISAKKRFENHFTGEIMGKRYAELYHSIL